MVLVYGTNPNRMVLVVSIMLGIGLNEDTFVASLYQELIEFCSISESHFLP